MKSCLCIFKIPQYGSSWAGLSNTVYLKAMSFIKKLWFMRWRITWILSPGFPSFITDISVHLYFAVNMPPSGSSFSRACDLSSPPSLRSRLSSSLTSRLVIFHSADVMTDEAIAPEADAWTQCDFGAAPWAHAQIREDIRNPSPHLLFNHTGRRGNVFIDQIAVRILRVPVCVCVFMCHTPLTLPLQLSEYSHKAKMHFHKALGGGGGTKGRNKAAEWREARGLWPS